MKKANLNLFQYVKAVNCFGVYKIYRIGGIGMTFFLLCPVAIFLAGILQSTTGFGYALIAIPVLSLILDPHLVIPLVMSVSFLTICLNVKKVWKHSDKRVLKRLLIGSVIGIPIGGLLYVYLDIDAMRLFISIAILSMTLVLMLQKYIKTFMRKIQKLDWLFGTISGFLTTSTGIPGPPIMLYLAANNTEKGHFRGTGISYLFLIYPITLTLLLSTQPFQTELFELFLYLAPFSFLGLWVGNKIHDKISMKMFTVITYCILLTSGVYSLIRNLV